jgi:hypothetical protein
LKGGLPCKSLKQFNRKSTRIAEPAVLTANTIDVNSIGWWCA